MTLKLAYIPATADAPEYWEVQNAMRCYHPACEVGWHWFWLTRTENRDKALRILVPRKE